MNKLVKAYLRHPRLIGSLYCILPTCAFFIGDLAMLEFRPVYLLRLAISVVLGGWLSGWLNEFGLKLVLIKHRSKEGPATVLDGAVVGASVGIGCALIPAASLLISSSHLEYAKWAVIGLWFEGLVSGGMVGAILASVGLKRIPRK